MSKDSISITVVICTYNGEKYVEAQLQSVLSQSKRPNEIIISDDCSSDNTLKLLKKWESKFPKLIHIHTHDSNQGYNKNFSFALSKVTSDYVALCDQDDIWYDNKLEVLTEFVLKYPGVVLFHHNEEILGHEGEYPEVPTNDHWKPYEGSSVGILFLLNRVTGHRMMIKFSLLEKILPIPDGIIYDWWISVVASTYGSVKYIPLRLMAYRPHEDSAYFSNLDKQLDNVTNPIKTALKHFKSIEGYNKYDRNYLNQLTALYANHQGGKFDIRLFLFFLKNRNKLFKDFVVVGSPIRKKTFLIRLCRAFSKR